MKKSNKRLNIFKAAASVALIACALGSTPVLADDLSELKEEKARLEQQQTKLQEEQRQIKNQQSDLESEKNQTRDEVDTLDTQLADLMSELDKMELQAAELNENIEQSKVDLADAQDMQSKQYADMKLRVQYMYENQHSSVANAIVTSSDMGEALSKAEYVQKIYDYDRGALERLAETTKRIEDLSARLAQDMAELEREQELAQGKQKELDELIESKKSIVADLDKRIADAQAEIAKKENEEREARQQADETSKKIVEEEARIAAEEAARKAAEEAARKAAEEEAARRAAAEEAARIAASRAASASGAISSASRSANTSASQASSSSGSSSQSTTPSASYSSSSSSGNSGQTTSSYSSGSASGSSIVSTAYNYIGVPYVWGGTSPSGFDCSGLVQYVYRQNGISLPRTSGAQAGVGYGVSLSQASPGDIVCYPGHVAIYIGGGKVIHAPYPGTTVQVANVNMMSITTIRHVV